MFHLVVAILGREVGIVVTLEKLDKQCSLGKTCVLALGMVPCANGGMEKWYLSQQVNSIIMSRVALNYLINELYFALSFLMRIT